MKGNIVANATREAAPALALSGRNSLIIRLIGFIGLLAAAVLIIGGGTVWAIVTSQLKAENITVSDDAEFLPGASVEGPFSAYAQAAIINHHALQASEGKTYAELEQDDPVRATVMNASVLRASLFTSVVSYGVSAFAMGMGLIVGLFGAALLALVPRAKRTKQ